MAAYIVGMIVGMITLLFPIAYAMHFDGLVATILAQNPQLSSIPIEPLCREGVLYGTSVLGAVVLLLSAALTAFTGLRRLRAQDDTGAKPAEPEL